MKWALPLQWLQYMKYHREKKGLALQIGGPGTNPTHIHSFFEQKFTEPLLWVWYISRPCDTVVHETKLPQWSLYFQGGKVSKEKKKCIIQFQEVILVGKKMKVEMERGSTGSGVGGDCFRDNGQGRTPRRWHWSQDQWCVSIKWGGMNSSGDHPLLFPSPLPPSISLLSHKVDPK